MIPLEEHTYKISHNGVTFIRKVKIYERNISIERQGDRCYTDCEIKALVDFYIEELFMGRVDICLPQPDIGVYLCDEERAFLDNVTALEDTW